MDLQRALRNTAGHLLALGILATVAGTSLGVLARSNGNRAAQRDSDREVLYLPNGDALELVSFGYKNVLAHLLWFKTISYFGKHYATDRNYSWLAHQCDLVTQLMPRALYTYTFCANMLSWEAGLPEQSIKVLNRGVEHNPRDWILLYYRGITHLAFLEKAEPALADFRAASALPNAPALVKRLAAKTMAQLNGPESAVEFLEEMLAQESDPNARQVLLHKLETLRKPRGN